MTTDKSSLKRRALLGGLAAAPVLSALPVSAAAARSDVKSWYASVDVVVVGSGVAGTSAAIAAGRDGARVLVLESLAKLGGSSAMSGGVVYAGGGTALQKACGIEDSVDAMRAYILAASGLYAQRDKVDLYCEQSPEHFDWLVQQGVHYEAGFTSEKGLPGTTDSLYYSGSEQVHEFAQSIKPAPRGHVPGFKGWTGGRSLMEALIPSARRAGAKYLTGVNCERLIVESDGRVAGVTVQMDGETRHIRAKRGVILAAGGFIHNREMLSVYAPELAQCSVPWGNMGDQGMGIRMGMSVGGTAAQMHHGFAIMPLYLPDHVLKGIVVNERGQRFIGEDAYHAFLGHEIAFHQKGRAWLITDKTSQYGYDDYRVSEVARANSIQALEQKLGFAENALKDSVDYYNHHARKGGDPLLNKAKAYLSPIAKAPFIAYDLSVDKAFFPAHTFGGLRTNTRSEVLNAWNEPIPGLYAAGRTTAGLPVAPYIASGISVGDGSFFGRIAGSNAAGGRS
ncbi:MAG: flavoprotein [Spongiibacteraceae bacterium]|nr:flavoprotein [Spongiibacteraceae bacterium]